MLKKDNVNHELLKIMRFSLSQLMIAVAFASLVCASNIRGQKLLDQKVSFRLSAVRMDEVIERLQSAANVPFMYNPNIFDNRRQDVRFEEENLKSILDRILTPQGVTYEILKGKIILKRKAISLPDPVEGVEIAPKFEITGKVLDETGSPMPGVNVLVKGSQTGTATNADGLYSLELDKETGTGLILVFSFVGYTSLEESVRGRTEINVQLSPEFQNLSEVVVTALGISKEKKALTYAVSDVKGAEFTQARENNVANALTGKIAGVNASGMATGPGGSSRIVIRGNGSLNGNNQPLYVINGMPMDNSIPGGGTASDGNGTNVDRGDGIGGINPDDIESISVLKGGPAAALYGARAANGVILITTKKGYAQKGVGVEINSSTTFEDIAVIPNWQYEYGQGIDGVKPATIREAINTGRLSFGPKMDGQPYIQVDGQMHPYSPQRNNLKNFYRTGSNYVNSVSFVGGSEAVSFRVGLNNTKANSIVPNSSFTRRIANVNLNANLTRKLSLETVFQYNIEEGKNRPKVGYADMNLHWATYLAANTVDIRTLAPGYDPETGAEMLWNSVAAAPNPYFVVNRFRNDDSKNRYITQGSLRYEITDHLALKGSVSRDFYNFKSEFIQPTGSADKPLGTYESITNTASETNAMLTLTYQKTFGDWDVSAMAGSNLQRSVYENQRKTGSEFTIPFFYSPTNLGIENTVPEYFKSGINSWFGSVDLGFKDFAYLTLSGRQDWFSVLNPDRNSIFYPSVGGSVILSEVLRLPEVISFAKLRGSWAQVGGVTVNPYQINQYFALEQGGHNGRTIQRVWNSQVPNPDLEPLTSITYEAGLEARLFRNRIGVDLTLYNRKTRQDMVATNIALSSGYTSALLNVGELSNKGIELLLTGTPYKRADIKWDVSYNMAYNVSKIEKLSEGLDYTDVGSGVGGGVVRNVLGRPYGTVWGFRKLTDESGNTVYNSSSGYAVRGPLEEIGQGIPPLTMGITNNFSYKNFSLNVLVDGKFGAIVYSNLYQYAYRFGLPQETLPGRDTGITVEGVNEEGLPFTKTWGVADVDTYYDNDKNYTSMFMFNNDFIKLRQIIFSYNLPASFVHSLKMQSASVSFVARNPFILYRDKKNQYFDPESGYTSGNAQGLEAFGVPRTRSLGVNVMVKF